MDSGQLQCGIASTSGRDTQGLQGLVTGHGDFTCATASFTSNLSHIFSMVCAN